jgi:hypothetical protein
MTGVNFQPVIYEYLSNLTAISQPFLFLPGLPSNGHDRLRKTTPKEVWTLFGVARERDLVFIAIGKLHVGLACDIRVITSSK